MSKFEDNMTDVFNMATPDPEVREIDGELVEVEISPNSGAWSKRDDIKKDYEYSRKNLIDIINHAKEALDELQNIASQTEAPRAFEVYANLMRTIADANKDLLESQERHQKLIGESKPEKQVTNNTLMIGSTSELHKLIAKLANDDC